MTKVTCAFAEARISKENSVFTVRWIQVFVHSGVALQARPTRRCAVRKRTARRILFTSTREGPRVCRRQAFGPPRGSLNVMKTHLEYQLQINSEKNRVR